MPVKINLKPMRNVALFLIACSLNSCMRLQPRKPLNKKDTVFFEESVVRNRAQNSYEQELIQKAIAVDSILNYSAAPSGFWYAYLKQNQNPSPRPQKGDQVVFSYRIENLAQELLYNEESLGKVTYYIDEEELLPGLRKGVKLMQAGEVVAFYFPSYLCYAYQGDGEKIGINQPLRFIVHLESLIKN